MSLMSLENLTLIRKTITIEEGSLELTPLTLQAIGILASEHKSFMQELYKKIMLFLPKNEQESIDLQNELAQSQFMFFRNSLEKSQGLLEIVVKFPVLTAEMIVFATGGNNLNSEQFKEALGKVGEKISVGSQVQLFAEIISMAIESLKGAGDLVKKIINISPQEASNKENKTGLIPSQS